MTVTNFYPAFAKNDSIPKNSTLYSIVFLYLVSVSSYFFSNFASKTSHWNNQTDLDSIVFLLQLIDGFAKPKEWYLIFLFSKHIHQCVFFCLSGNLRILRQVCVLGIVTVSNRHLIKMLIAPLSDCKNYVNQKRCHIQQQICFRKDIHFHFCEALTSRFFHRLQYTINFYLVSGHNYWHKIIFNLVNLVTNW